MGNQQRLPPTTTSSPNYNTMQQEPPHLSGAYIRRLVKHLSSSSTTRSKDHHHITMGNKAHGQPQKQEQQSPSQTTPPPPKKQVRRRLHTSRPYQERLLNMAEARREIVTALKIHRASMRQAKEQQQQEQLVQQLQHQQDVQVAWSAPMSSYGLSFSDYLHNSSPSPQFTATSNSYSYYSSPSLPYHTPVAAPMVPMVDDALDRLLPPPAQLPLGLNLSFHGFGGVVAGQDDDKGAPTGSFDPPPLLQPSPASSYSVYSSPPPATAMAGNDDGVSCAVTAAAENTSLHRVLDDEEMAAICSAGELHDIEWSDTMNLVTSAWWNNLLESGDGSAVTNQRADDGANAVVDVVGMHLSDEYYGQDISLPRMDLGEIEGWETEWFS